MARKIRFPGAKAKSEKTPCVVRSLPAVIAVHQDDYPSCLEPCCATCLWLSPIAQLVMMPDNSRQAQKSGWQCTNGHSEHAYKIVLNKDEGVCTMWSRLTT